MKAIRKPFKLPNRNSYYVDIDGKRRSLGTTDHREAMRMYRQMCERLEEKEAMRLSPLFANFKTSYLEWANGVRSKKTLEADRLALNTLARHVPPGASIDELTARHIDDMVAACLKRGNKKTSVNCYIRHIKSVFRKAEQWHGITSPFAKTKLLKTDKKPPRYLTLNEISAFLGKFEDKERRLLALAYLATGRRRNELLNLQWKDVELENGRYFVAKSKAHMARWYPISATFRGVLDQLPRDRQFVFVQDHPDTVTHWVKAGLCAIGKNDMRLHDLRHSFASLFVQAGGNLRVLQDLMGHSSYSVTEIYAHMAPDVLSREIDRVNLSVDKKPPI